MEEEQTQDRYMYGCGNHVVRPWSVTEQICLFFSYPHIYQPYCMRQVMIEISRWRDRTAGRAFSMHAV